MLEEVKAIKDLTTKVDKIEIKLSKFKGADKTARKLRKEKYDTLEDIDEYRERYMARIQEAHNN